jgi:hypothetical protein
MVKTFLPAVRGLTAHALAQRGHSQSAIARLLGTSQAAVSQSLDRPASRYRDRLTSRGVEPEALDAHVNLLVEDLLRDPFEATVTLYSLWRRLMASGELEHAHPPLPLTSGPCPLCTRLFKTPALDATQEAILADLGQAVELLERHPEFLAVMPHVSVNVVRALPDARSEADVAAIPGRLVKLRGGVRALQRAEFGASRHMAQVLLTVRRFVPDVGAAVNLRYDARMAPALAALGLRWLPTPDKRGLDRANGDIVVAAIEGALRGATHPVEAIADEGGFGLEPNLYVFGGTAVAAVERALEIARRYAQA